MNDKITAAPGAAPTSPGAAPLLDTGSAAVAGAIQAPSAAAAAPAPAVPQNQLDAPSLLGAAKAEKPAGAAPDAKTADTKTDSKSSPVDATTPAEGAAVVDAKAQDGKAEGDKPQDAKPEGDKPKAEDPAKAKEPGKDDKPKAEGDVPKDAKADAPEPVKYEAFTVPEGMKLDDDRVKALTEIIGPLQVPQEAAQKIVDVGTAWLKDAGTHLADHMRKEQRDTWNTLNNEWRDEFRGDREIGGNRSETTLARAKAVIEEYLSPDQAKRYLAHIDMNGMSNFVEHIRLLSNIGEALNVFEDKMVAAPAVNPNAGKQQGFRRNYRNSGNGRSA